MSNRIRRKDGSIVRTYAPGDGHLSYGVDRDDGRAAPYDVTDTEADALCPPGWAVYLEGPYHRARPA